jgi:hypothetical protein
MTFSKLERKKFNEEYSALGRCLVFKGILIDKLSIMFNNSKGKKTKVKLFVSSLKYALSGIHFTVRSI